MAFYLLEIFVSLGSVWCILSLNITKQDCMACYHGNAISKEKYHQCMMAVTDMEACKSAESVETGCDITDEEDDKAFWNLLEIQNEVCTFCILVYFLIK